MRRRLNSISLAAFLFALVALAPAIGAAAPQRGLEGPDVTELIPDALERIQKAKKGAFAKAVLLEAEGLPGRDDPVEDASGISRWRFVADNQKTKRSKFLSVYVDWEAGDGFGKVNGVKSPFLEDRRMKNPPGMTLEQAVTHLRGAGFTDPFANVTLRRPILESGPTPPLYIFGFEGDSYVAVDTKSGEAAPF